MPKLSRQAKKCSLRVHTRNNEIIKEIGTHIYAADIHELESLRAMANIRYKAKRTNDVPVRMIENQ